MRFDKYSSNAVWLLIQVTLRLVLCFIKDGHGNVGNICFIKHRTTLITPWPVCGTVAIPGMHVLKGYCSYCGSFILQPQYMA